MMVLLTFLRLNTAKIKVRLIGFLDWSFSRRLDISFLRSFFLPKCLD